MFYIMTTAPDEEQARDKLTLHIMSPTLPMVHHYETPSDIPYDLWVFQVDDDDLLRLVDDNNGEHVSDVFPKTSLQQDVRIVDLNA